MRSMCVAERGLRVRGAALDALLARPDNPKRCTLPITALRVTPPSSAAIWLAERPSAQSFFNSSTRSSVHDMLSPPQQMRAFWPWRNPPSSQAALAAQHARLTNALDKCPPHEMSYLTSSKLQYGGSRAQESRFMLPHVPFIMWTMWGQPM